MSTSRRRRRGRRRIIGGVVLVVGVLAYLFWPGGDGDDASRADAAGSPPAAQQQTQPSTAERPVDTETSRPTRPDETNLTGRSPVPAGLPRLDGSSASGSTTPPARAAQRAPGASSERSTPTRVTSAASGSADQRVRQGMALIGDGKLVEGRAVLSEVLLAEPPVLSAADADTVRTTLSSVNQRLVFSKEVLANDPLTSYHRVASGEYLGRDIAPKYHVPYAFLEMINAVDARRLQAGANLKVVHGPFHAVVTKRDYRMDVYLRGEDGKPVYVMSVPVGLGEDDSTPMGLWRIKAGSKVRNPDWRNPRTGEYFGKDDPDNPIGDYWMAIEGLDENTEGKKGYGLHGTVDRDSIGAQRSMGCIRLRDQDIELMFKMLEGGQSTVRIVP